MITVVVVVVVVWRPLFESVWKPSYPSPPQESSVLIHREKKEKKKDFFFFSRKHAVKKWADKKSRPDKIPPH
jgi:hypothetical protein